MDDDAVELSHMRRSSDVNSKIMLTAIISLSLVVVIVCVLHIYARLMLRRQARRQASLRSLGYIVNTRPVDPPKTGLNPAVIAALPKFLFKQSAAADHASSVECAVCLSMLEDGDMARSLPNCKHTFHADCIDRWFESNSTCPICRTQAEPRLAAEPREGMVAPATAPPLEGTSDGGSASGKISRTSSRLSSFRRILSRDRSSRRMQIQSEDGLPDLERQ